MEDLGGILMFLIFLGIAGLAKLSEVRRRKHEESERLSRRKRPEDLPERTRQMLYGGDIPTATARRRTPSDAEQAQKEATATPPAAEQDDEPLSVEDLFEAMVGGAGRRRTQARPQPRPTPSPRSTPSSETRRPQAAPPPRPPRPPRRPQAERPTARQPASSPQVAKRAASRLQQPSLSTKTSAAARGVTPKKIQPPRKTVPATRSAATDGEMILRDGFFEDIQAVRRGIVISEILGKPRGLQGLDAWGDIG